MQHAQGLYNRGRAKADWAFLPRSCFVDLADTRHWIDEALDTPDQLPFAIVDAAREKVVGSTRFLSIRPEHRSMEIGWTWIGQEWQRTAANTEAKLLLLTHAFEQLGCVRVEFKTDARNERSQQALLRIGATREGVLRNHMIVQNNFLRDSVYFSVIEAEWPEVKKRLEVLVSRSD
jgi:RimJ/RimL family protein N-acetyltransferase